jgi:hypothetical protein
MVTLAPAPTGTGRPATGAGALPWAARRINPARRGRSRQAATPCRTGRNHVACRGGHDSQGRCGRSRFMIHSIRRNPSPKRMSAIPNRVARDPIDLSRPLCAGLGGKHENARTQVLLSALRSTPQVRGPIRRPADRMPRVPATRPHPRSTLRQRVHPDRAPGLSRLGHPRLGRVRALADAPAWRFQTAPETAADRRRRREEARSRCLRPTTPPDVGAYSR